MKKRNLKGILALAMAGVMMAAMPAAAFADTVANFKQDGPPDMPGGSSSSSSSSALVWTGATTFNESADVTDGIFTSTNADENAVLVDGGSDVSVSLAFPQVTKSGGNGNGDNYNFYGINSAVVAKGGATLSITRGTITSDADGANGVFSYGGNGGKNGAAGDGTTVYIANTNIKTTGSNAGGIMTTGGGVTVAENLEIETEGRSSAAIRTDRGGGTVTVNGGTFVTSGLGSPAIYSTADITVNDSELTSNLSEGVCIEGKNSITLNDCDMTADNSSTNGNATFLDTIMIYQSMSGDADSGTSKFSMSGGSLTSKSGHTFHVTNTHCVITLEDVEITNSDDDVLISVCDDGWSGAANIATLNASNQVLNGTILVGDDTSDGGSSLTLNLLNGSVFTGDTSGVITNYKSNEQISSSLGTLDINIEEGSTWVLTGDSEVSSLSGAGSINYNGHTLTVNGTAYTSGNIGDISETTEEPTESSGSEDYEIPTDSDDGSSTDTGNSGSTTPTTPSDGGASSGSEAGNTDTTTETTTSLSDVVFKNVTKSFSVKALKKSKKTYSVIKSSGAGTVSAKYVKKAKKYVKVSKTGKVTVKKNTPKGTYKVKLTVAANSTYKAASQTIVVKVKK